MAIRLDIEDLIKGGNTSQKIDQSLISFGQSKSCHIELNHPEVGHRHFVIKFIDDGYALIDEGSVYGTSLDGQKLEPQTSYALGLEHRIDIPGFIIKIHGDGQQPRLEQTRMIAANLLGKSLQDKSTLHKSPYLRSNNGHYIFNFVDEKTSFVLGTDILVDFVLDGSGVHKKHVSFVRDINGIRLIPIVGHAVYIDGSRVNEAQILAHGSLITIGETEFVYHEHEDNNDDALIRE